MSTYTRIITWTKQGTTEIKVNPTIHIASSKNSPDGTPGLDILVPSSPPKSLIPLRSSMTLGMKLRARVRMSNSAISCIQVALSIAEPQKISKRTQGVQWCVCIFLRSKQKAKSRSQGVGLYEPPVGFPHKSRNIRGYFPRPKRQLGWPSQSQPQPQLHLGGW